MDIAELQVRIAAAFGARDRTRGPDGTFRRLVEEVGVEVHRDAGIGELGDAPQHAAAGELRDHRRIPGSGSAGPQRLADVEQLAVVGVAGVVGARRALVQIRMQHERTGQRLHRLRVGFRCAGHPDAETAVIRGELLPTSGYGRGGGVCHGGRAGKDRRRGRAAQPARGEGRRRRGRRARCNLRGGGCCGRGHTDLARHRAEAAPTPRAATRRQHKAGSTAERQCSEAMMEIGHSRLHRIHAS